LWSSVLAVVAHPDDESLGLGAVLESFARAGTSVTVLSLTHGAASTRHGISGDLTQLRAAELRSAASELGVINSILSDHPMATWTGTTSCSSARWSTPPPTPAPKGWSSSTPRG
jgi:LmbE family N-acetylglucosaminyl deacetylase